MNVKQCFRGASANGAAGWWFGFSYDLNTIEALKHAIPPQDRAWDPERKLWWVLDTEPYRDVLVRLFPDIRAYFDQPQLF